MPKVTGSKGNSLPKTVRGAATRLVNRGPAGLLNKTRDKNKPPLSQHPNGEAPTDRIAEALSELVVSIADLVPDPNNARLHPERNLEAIKDSLRLYGQVKPLVVRREGSIVVAGNGTLEAAKALGWTKLAAAMVEMTDVEAAGYGLADNRTAELAKWDFEVVARLDKLLFEANHAQVGWTLDELEVLRCADWTPPTVDDTDVGRKESPLVIGFTPDQYEMVGQAIEALREELGQPDRGQADCLASVCEQWLTLREGGECLK